MDNTWHVDEGNRACHESLSIQVIEQRVGYVERNLLRRALTRLLGKR